MSELFDASAYVRPPVLNVSGAVSLATALLNAVPKDASAPVRAAARSSVRAPPTCRTRGATPSV